MTCSYPCLIIIFLLPLLVFTSNTFGIISSSPSFDVIKEVLHPALGSHSVYIFSDWKNIAIKAPLDNLIIECPAIESFDTLQLISFLLNSPIWNFDTKVILVFTITPGNISANTPILESLSTHGIFNAIIYHRKSEKSHQIILHHPFEPPTSAISILENIPVTNSLCFPDKVKDLHGFKLTVNFLPYNTYFINESGRVTTIDRHFMQILMDTLNATYETKSLVKSSSELQQDLNATSDLIATRMIFIDEVNLSKFEQIYTPDSFKLGVVITSNRIEDPWLLMKTYFQDAPVLFAIGFIQFLLFNWFVLKRRGWRIFSYNAIVPLNIQQPARIPGPSRTARIFAGGVIWFNLISFVRVLTLFTSKSIAYLPDRSIATVEQVIEREIPLYADIYGKFLMFQYGNDRQRMIADVTHFYDGNLWAQNFPCPTKCAFIVEMGVNENLLASAINLNDEGEAQFYKLKEEVFQLPKRFLLPLNSPYKNVWNEVWTRTIEGGLESHWIVKELTENSNSPFKYFNLGVEGGEKVLPQRIKELVCVFLLLGFGLSVALVVFIGEIVLFRCKRGSNSDYFVYHDFRGIRTNQSTLQDFRETKV